MTADRFPRVAGVCYASPYLGLVVMAGDSILAVRSSRVHRRRPEHLRAHLARFVAAHQPERIVLEAATAARLAIDIADPTFTVMTLPSVKHRVLHGVDRPTHVTLYHHLLRRDPRLQRLVCDWPTRHNAWRRPWQRARLLAVALLVADELATFTLHPSEL